jgi:serine/threonine protein phosphatase PrpC
MKFNICGFTHKGTGIYSSNEDNMLINGNQFNEGELFLTDQNSCICFVSDGVGGSKAGDFASAFVLSKIKEQTAEQLKDLNNYLIKVNENLLEISQGDESKRGCACTLSGIIAAEGLIDMIHIGDSEIWLLRNDMFIKITKDEVADEDNVQSPITNYFGGPKNNLKINTDWEKPELLAKDILLLCSDGLFKALNVKLVKPILSSAKTLQEKVLKLKENCLSLGSEDNVTAVIIEIINNE